MAQQQSGAIDRWRLGVVSYLNSRPLVQGLDHDPCMELIYDVPSHLPGMLDRADVHVALVPVVDLVQPGRDWQIVSDACIGCDGETLTVRVFSRGKPETVRTLHVDGDSHTSVILATVIWQRLFNTRLEIRPYRGVESADECEAILLIGDKVVRNTLIDFEVETDLGSAWKSLTMLPFVFAVWAARAGVDARSLAERLSTARDAGVRSAELIAADYGPGLGFPVALATRYLTSRLRFNLGPREREGMVKFLEFARELDLIPAGPELAFA